MNILAFVVYALAAFAIGMILHKLRNPPMGDTSIIFKEPRVILPGDRLADFRIKKARIVDPQKPEGNEVKWKFRHINKEDRCGHVYWPVMEGDKPLGQRCSLCGKFNSIEQLQAEWSRVGLS